jgi:3-methyladenine DNA glycosylase AlkD
MEVHQVLAELTRLSSPTGREGMARFGINPAHALGLRIPVIQKFAKKINTDHPLALALWKSGIHEARILAAFIADPKQLTEAQMEKWAMEFDSWDICDQCCIKLFRKHPLARKKALEWAQREEEFVKRAGFALMATLAVHDKKADNDSFDEFLEMIYLQADDPRIMVKKAINWALRQIGKRNTSLLTTALYYTDKIKQRNTSAARWVASDAFRELTHPKTSLRIKSG